MSPIRGVASTPSGSGPSRNHTRASSRNEVDAREAGVDSEGPAHPSRTPEVANTNGTGPDRHAAADENTAGNAGPLRRDVQAMVEAVHEVHVGGPRWSKERLSPLRPSGADMGSSITFGEVSLDLADPQRAHTGRGSPDEVLAQQKSSGRDCLPP